MLWVTREPSGVRGCPEAISWEQAPDHVGLQTVLTGQVVSFKSRGKGAFLNIGRDYPSRSRLTAVVWEPNQHRFPGLDDYEGAVVCVAGTVSLYKGSPQVELTDPNQLWIGK
jgi:exonuclease VII large subunit